ncbi:MAG: ribosome-binding ATPase YchF [Candidatus Parcubacteria bacterium]|nr:MAG: ribosome-binding ATPase YchF [Candidatus Parcubacteria bacterium]
MKIKIGLCGLPNSGKSTFIKLVSQVEVLIASYPFTTLKAQEYAVPIFSDELKLLHSITQTKEVIPPYLFFVDVPGLIRGAHKGDGLGNEFLSYLRGCDVILEIVRNFKREEVPHPEGDINPLRDIKIIEEEIFLADKEIIERTIKKLEKEKNKEGEEKIKALENILTKIYSELNRTNSELTETNTELVESKIDKIQRFTEFNELLKEFNLLLTKEWFLLINGEATDLHGFNSSTDLHGLNLPTDLGGSFKNVYNLDLLWEIELIESKIQENEFKPKVFDFLNQFRKDLGLIQFFTFTRDITQGWFVKKDSSMIEAATLIHTDFGVKFKIAETIFLEDFVKICKSRIDTDLGTNKYGLLKPLVNTDKNRPRIVADHYWEEARKLGIIKNKGRDAKVEENEIIFVKI